MAGPEGSVLSETEGGERRRPGPEVLPEMGNEKGVRGEDLGQSGLGTLKLDPNAPPRRGTTEPEGASLPNLE